MSARRAGRAGRLAAVALAALGALAVAAGPAVAGDRADELFAKGKRLLAKQRYAEACDAFERVDRLDPGIGAKLNVARCYEEWGKLARAHRWYTDAEQMARDTGDKRAPKIAELIAELEPAVPRLTLVARRGADLAAAAITLDGEPVDEAAIGRETRVDPGPHVIAYRAGGEARSETIALERGGAREVRLQLGGRRGRDVRKSDGTPAPGRAGRGRRLAGIAMVAAGVASFGVGSYLALDARSDYNRALDAECMGARDACSDEGLRLTRDARDQANTATIFAVAGAVVAAGGAVLYLTAPRGAPAAEHAGARGGAARRRRSRDEAALYVAPAIGARAGLLVLGGRY